MQLVNMNNNIKNGKKRVIYLFLFFPLLLIICFIIVPLLLMIMYSFTDWNGYSPTMNFVGLENYHHLFIKDNIEPFKVTLYYLISAIGQLLIGIYLAVYVYFKKRFKSLIIIIILLPILINTVAVGLIFRLFLMPGGMFDMLLDKFHIINFVNENESIKWIGNADIVNHTLALITIWRYTPFTFILIYGAFLSVDQSIVKAAIQVGASKFRITWDILLPNIKVTLVIVTTSLIIGAISTIELPLVMTGGALGTKTIIMRIQEVAFSMRNFGMASVISLFVVALILLIVIIRLQIGRGDEK